jgi:hypothetical protein
MKNMPESTLLDICPEKNALLSHLPVNFSFSPGWGAGAEQIAHYKNLYYRKRDLKENLQIPQPG